MSRGRTRRCSGGSSDSPSFYVFDVLVLSGHNVMPEPLAKRRELLRKHVLPKLKDPIRESLQLNAALADVINVVRVQWLEGVVAKDLNSSYEPGQRSGAWRKMRINKGQEFVIGGIPRAQRSSVPRDSGSGILDSQRMACLWACI